MKIEFLNLNETELEELRTLEKENSDQCMLAITKGAFDGVAVAALIVSGIQTVVTVISFILQCKDRRAKEREANNTDGAGAKKVEIVIHSPDGRITHIELTDATKDTLTSILNLQL